MKFGERTIDLYKAERVLTKEEYETLTHLIKKVDTTKRNFFKINL